MTKALSTLTLTLALAAAVALSACGSSGGEDTAQASVQSGLAKIKRGTLSLKFTGGAGEADNGHDVGFALDGPFDLSGKPGTLPIARLRFRQLRGANETATTFVSTGERAFVLAGGTTVELGDDQLQSLRLTKPKDTADVAGLHLDEWATGPAQAQAGQMEGGVAVERTDSDVDPVQALNDIFGLARQFGRGVKAIEGQAADDVRKAVRSARMTLLVGVQDRLVRKLALDITFGTDGPTDPAVGQALSQALGDLSAARLHLDLSIDRPNQPIERIEAPSP
jgi:hypothetical protein